MDAHARRTDHQARLIEIIRRDLMLGADVPLTAETRLFGGEFDLDSLDALLLMQSLEREFGFKIPSESFKPDLFHNISTLVEFVGRHADQPSSRVA